MTRLNNRNSKPHDPKCSIWAVHRSLALPIFALTAISSAIFAAPKSMGPLSQFIDTYSDESWSVQDDGTSVYFENRQSEGAITYYYLNSPKEALGTRSVSVDVAFGQSTQWSLAGLLYGYTENPKSYYLFTVGGDVTINVLQWHQDELELLEKLEVQGLSADKTTLEIREDGQSVTVLVNNKEVQKYSDAQLGRGGVGIVASDIGQYKFSNFKLTENTNTNTAKSNSLTGGFTMPSSSANANIGSKPNSTRSTDAKQTGDPTNNGTRQTSAVKKNQIDPVKYFGSPDTRFGGMISSYTPFPASWKQIQGGKEFLYTGPNGIKVSSSFGQIYSFSENADGQQMLAMQGTPNTPPMSIERIIENLFMPVARQTKRELTRHYPLPGLSQTMGDFSALLFKSVPVQETVSSHALEWRDNKGMSYITTVTIKISRAFPISTWNVQGQYLQVETASFEAARDAYIYGVENTEINAKWLQVANQRDAQRAGRSWAAHQSRMSVINARAKASKSVSDIYSEISDINHAGYLKRSNMQSQGQASSVRGINEQTLIAEQNTGERYTVDGQSNYHWVNTNGVYVGTDNPLFDPRTDENLKMFDWTQFQSE